MDLATYRKRLALSQEQVATALGLSRSSKSWISDIETGERTASLRLALKIENWSHGQVRAASLNAQAAELARSAAKRRPEADAAA